MDCVAVSHCVSDDTKCSSAATRLRLQLNNDNDAAAAAVTMEIGICSHQLSASRVLQRRDRIITTNITA